ncbi:MAG TPA: hypothetical protein PLG46_12230 [Ornithinibacter sp.]|nr:hypothetical protein [Ornithinibacter sp.]
MSGRAIYRQPPTEEQLATERRVLELRRAGVDYRTIAQQVGYANPSSAKRAVDRALARAVTPVADEVRVLEADRLDRLQLAHWRKALQGDPVATRIVLDIMCRRAELLGLDHRHGMAERAQRLNEAQAVILAELVAGALRAAHVDDQQRQEALTWMHGRLTQITAADEDLASEDLPAAAGDVIETDIVPPDTDTDDTEGDQ